MPYKYNPETGKYDIEISLSDARAEGYGNMSDQEKRQIYDAMAITNPYTDGSFEITNNPDIGQEYTSMNKSGYGTTTDYDHLDSIGIDTTNMRKRGTGRVPQFDPLSRGTQYDPSYDSNIPGTRNPHEEWYYGPANPHEQFNPGSPERIKVLKEEIEKRGGRPLELKTSGFPNPFDSANWDLGNQDPFRNDIAGTMQRTQQGMSINEALHDQLFGSPLSEDQVRQVADAIYFQHDYAGVENIPSGMIPYGYTASEMFNEEYGGGHTLTFNDQAKLKEAYINALNEGYHQGMIPAGARIGDSNVTAIISAITGLDHQLVARLGSALAGASASAVTMSAFNNFPLAAMAYFGVNTLMDNNRQKRFEGVELGGAQVDGISIPQLKLTLPAGLPNSIFKDYRYICYDRVSLKWYPSDEVQPLNYDGGNDYRWLCLDRVTGDIYKSNTIKRPRIFLD